MEIRSYEFLLKLLQNANIKQEINWDDLHVDDFLADKYDVPLSDTPKHPNGLFGEKRLKNVLKYKSSITKETRGCLLYTLHCSLSGLYATVSAKDAAEGIITTINDFFEISTSFLQFEEEESDSLRKKKIECLIDIVRTICQFFHNRKICEISVIAEALHKNIATSKAYIRSLLDDSHCRTLFELNNDDEAKSPFSNTGFKIQAGIPYIKAYQENRSQEIDVIDNHFKKNNLLFLYGMGGIGKSVLATLYGKHIITNQGNAYFVKFQKSFFDTLSNIAISGFKVFDDQGNLKDAQTIFQEKMEILASCCTSDTVFIIDNAYDNAKSFDELISYDGKNYAYETFLQLPCKKIITTRYEILDDTGKEVPPLALNALLDIMNTYYPHDIENTQNIRVQLIEAVYRHTLSVELIARSLKALRGTKTPEQVLTILQANDMTNDNLPKVHSDINYRKDTIFNHLCSLFTLCGLSQTEKILLSQTALISTIGLHSRVFFECCYNGLGSIDVVNDLIEKGWIMFEEYSNTFSMHPLIQSVLNNKLGSEITHKNNFVAEILEIDTPTIDEALQIAGIIQTAYADKLSLPLSAATFLITVSTNICLFDPDSELPLSELDILQEKSIAFDSVALSIAESCNDLSDNEIEELRSQIDASINSIKEYFDSCRKSQTLKQKIKERKASSVDELAKINIKEAEAEHNK